MKFDCDVLIVGGGLNGPALALALAGGGLSSIVLDAAPEPERRDADFDGRGYALSLTSLKMLGVLGLRDRIEDTAQPIEAITISDGRAGEGAAPWPLHFDQAEIDEAPMGAIVEDRHLRPALLDALAETDPVQTRSRVRVTDQNVTPVGVTVTLDTGETLSARLLVGCDGRNSSVADRAGISRLGWDYGQTSLVCAIEHDLPHEGRAHQFFMPPGPLAILPLKGNRSSIVWTESKENARQINGMDEAAYIEVLRPRFGDFLGEIRLAGKRYSYPLALSVADAFVADRVALAGDAAHGIHPLAGQGLNLGLRDVASLAETVVSASRLGRDIGALDVLQEYQRWRRFDTAMLVAATDGLNRLFSNDNPLIRAARDVGLGVVNRMPSLRRGLIREAAGLSGDLPLLLRGRAL